MKGFIQHATFALLLVASLTSHAANDSKTNYHSVQYGIQVAIEELDFKKIKTLVKSVIPILEEDISFSESILVEEEDHYIRDHLSEKIFRQKEILSELTTFIKTKKYEMTLAEESMIMVKELRRLSLRPKER